MSDEKQETIADIIAEKRERADEIERDVAAKMASGEMVSDQYAREVIADLRMEADRIDAAWKREKNAPELKSPSASQVSPMPINDTHIIPQIGNAAAMRKALLDIQEYAAAMDVDDGNVLAILDSCRDGLSAPQKNCDRFKTRKEARNYFDDFVCLRSNGSGAIDCKGCPLDSIDIPHRSDCREAWLFSPAEDRKGGNDGK